MRHGALRARLAAELAEWIDHGDFAPRPGRRWLQKRSRTKAAVALTSLDTTVDAATTAFADLFGTTVPECKERSVCDLVDPAYEVQDTFERLRRRRVRLLHRRDPPRPRRHPQQ